MKKKTLLICLFFKLKSFFIILFVGVWFSNVTKRVTSTTVWFHCGTVYPVQVQNVAGKCTCLSWSCYVDLTLGSRSGLARLFYFQGQTWKSIFTAGLIFQVTNVKMYFLGTYLGKNVFFDSTWFMNCLLDMKKSFKASKISWLAAAWPCVL